MRKLLLMMMLLIMPFSGIRAQSGLLSIFSDTLMTSCCADIAQYEIVDMYLFYIREEGPELGPYFEFRIKSTSDAIIFITPQFLPGCQYAGNYAKGFQVASSECLDSGYDYTYLGKIPALNMGDPDTFMVSIEGRTYQDQEPAIFVSYCDRHDNNYPVCGGSFLFNGSYTYCNPVCPIRPRLSGVLILSAYETRLRFTKELDPVTAENPSNYSIGRSGHRFPVLDATLQPDGETVILTNSEPFHRGHIYGTAVRNVQDLDGNLIAPRSGGTGYYGSDLWAKEIIVLSHRCNYEYDVAFTVENVSNIGARNFKAKLGFEAPGGSFRTLALVPYDTLGPYDSLEDTLTVQLPSDISAYMRYEFSLIVGFHDDEHALNKYSNEKKCSFEHVRFLSSPFVDDIDRDSGGWVHVGFYMDRVWLFPELVTHYEIYKRVSGDSSTSWELVDSIPHIGFDRYYTTEVPTTDDYIHGEDIPWEVFKVRVSTDDPFKFMESCPDSGYSIFQIDMEEKLDIPLTLFQNYPNPFNPVTEVSFYLPQEAHVQLDIFDVAGRIIQRLVNRRLEDGMHSVRWRGCDSNRNPTSSGVYFYRLKVDEKMMTRKMILLR